jgi:hypothetical protein
MPDAAALSTWLQVLFYVVGGVAACVVLWRHLQPRAPQQIAQPVVVESAPRYAQAVELERLSEDVQQLRDDVGRRLDQLTRDREAGAEKLHTRINEVLASLSEIRGELRRLPCSNCGGDR